ncbi:MAG TPA: response regulator [Chitinophagales bacterium]|nr:response regulator [Chitinophagales bacterium]
MQEHTSPFDLIMLVDDNKINNIINRKLFELMHFSKEIVEAGNGLEALDYLKAAATSNDRIPEVIFLDVYMPLMDGMGFLDEFKNLPVSILEKSRIIILSSTLDGNDYRRVHRSPYVVKFLEKPMNKQKLIDTDLKGFREQYLFNIAGVTHAA